MHSDRCGPRGGRGKVVTAGQWALQGGGFLEDSGCVILEPPGTTTSFSSSCTCCWRPMICRGLVLLGLSQLWLGEKICQKTKQHGARSCPLCVFGLVSPWVNVESWLSPKHVVKACPYILGHLPHELVLLLF